MKWLAYFKERQKQKAQEAMKGETLDSPIEYGEIIYQSAPFMGRRWLVTKFKEEFAVFVEFISRSGRADRNYANAFTSKDRAIAFATEMFLVCCGRVKLSNRRCLTKIVK